MNRVRTSVFLGQSGRDKADQMAAELRVSRSDVLRAYLAEGMQSVEITRKVRARLTE